MLDFNAIGLYGWPIDAAPTFLRLRRREWQRSLRSPRFSVVVNNVRNALNREIKRGEMESARRADDTGRTCLWRRGDDSQCHFQKRCRSRNTVIQKRMSSRGNECHFSVILSTEHCVAHSNNGHCCTGARLPTDCPGVRCPRP